MASREQQFMAGFMAASRILTTLAEQDRARAKEKGEEVLPTVGRQVNALENYLAIPTFIRQGRTIKLSG